MDLESKVTQVLHHATTSLQEAAKAKMKAENKIFSETMWVVELDLEYLTFILNLSRENPDGLWKESVKVAQVVDVDRELTTV